MILLLHFPKKMGNFFKFIYFERERERERAWEGQRERKREREREREKIPSRLHTASIEPKEGFKLTNLEIMT